MRQYITNTECALYDCEQCEFLNMKSCATCFVDKLDDDQAQSVLNDLKILQGLLPEEGVHGLFTSDECQLCKTDMKGERSCYAMIDLGHPEPKRKKRSAIGLKAYARMGSMVPIQISACKDCKRRILTLEYLYVLIPLFAGALGLALIAIPAIGEGLARLSPIMPLVLFCVFVGVSVLIALNVHKRLTKKYEKLTVLDPFELPTLAKMKANGWFALNSSNTLVRIIFSSKRVFHGAGTAIPGVNRKVLKIPRA